MQQQAFAVSTERIAPSGTFAPAECTHEVENGASVFSQVDGSVKVIALSGKVTIFPKCAVQPIQVTLPNHVSSNNAYHVFPENGWLMNAWLSNINFQLLRSVWNVPNPPPVSSGQLLYIFNGIESNQDIVQPVLQWGASPAGGGPYWALTSWWVNAKLQFIHSPLLRVNPGDRIVGISIQTTPGSWTITAIDLNTNQQSTLTVNNVSPLTYAALALEGYNISRCGNYPNGPVTFTQSQVANAGLFQSVNNWATGVGVNSCGQRIICSGRDCIFTWHNFA